MRTSVRAVVTVTLEIELSSRWSGADSTSFIFGQAVEEATDEIRRGLSVGNLQNGSGVKVPAKVVGSPHVRAIIVDLDSKGT